MKRFIELKNEFVIRNYNEKLWGIELTICHEEVLDFFMELQMISFQKSDLLTLKTYHSPRSLQIQLQQAETQSQVESKAENLKLKITERDMGVIYSFLLLYYRDAVAPVDHIDIELSDENDPEKEVYLIIKAEDFSEPISEKEARRILDM
ncbi:hypothetical protein QWJ34_26810 [Saccharibacillus sp. CPCC 101409]|uniref:hypothetical protein n=1 Tax=Saccharibacillus sp. CPCC 101409 TaxID=3058041 RepID=UPI0026733154|nr:hypothetical protein [Saccharibacillus sp. CPCC 101409]MDO3413389.1 hypothetical protein [Saccharibacillus sp. CPCC 101409]